MSWWNCPLCEFKMRDDGSVKVAQRMGKHIEDHENEEPGQKERAFQKGLADGHPGVLTPPGPHSEAEFRFLFDMVRTMQALREGRIGLQEYVELVRKLQVLHFGTSQIATDSDLPF